MSIVKETGVDERLGDCSTSMNERIQLLSATTPGGERAEAYCSSRT